MQDIHAVHRPPLGERRRGDARLPLPAARRCAALLPLVLLLVAAAAPAGAIQFDLSSDPAASLSTGDPDDGDHRELPYARQTVEVTTTLPELATTVAVVAPAPASPAAAPVRARALLLVRLRAAACLWPLVRIWFLHR